MPATNRADLERALPRLRHDLEISRRLAARAVERANRLAEQAQATRRVLEERLRAAEAGLTPDKQVWRAAAREVMRVSRERERDMGVVAHELRQPLAAALAAERLLAIHHNADAREHTRSVLARQLAHLSELIDSLLDYSRLGLHNAPFGRDAVDMAAVAIEAIEAIEPSAADRRLAIRWLPAVETANVAGDRVRLRQALLNLLQNAVRYTPPDGHIDVRLDRDDGLVRVAVCDSGEGIAPERIESAFDPFVRLSSAGPGLGIGLPLVRRIMELHGGTVTGASEGEGRGSTFTISLPAAPDSNGDREDDH
jgi:signal transduction histidine kinase